jgi:hypothetical protein
MVDGPIVRSTELGVFHPLVKIVDDRRPTVGSVGSEMCCDRFPRGRWSMIELEIEGVREDQWSKSLQRIVIENMVQRRITWNY